MSVGGDYGKASGPRAGFWRRFAALFVDGLILAIVNFLLLLASRRAGAALSIVAQAAYVTYFVGSSGQTPGQRILEIRTVDLRTGASIGYGRAFVRYLGSIVSALFIYLGYLWMLFDREKQTWHDKLAQSVVVPAHAYIPTEMADMDARARPW